MGNHRELLERYPCADYIHSGFAAKGLWDEDSQVWVIEPLQRAEELPAIEFLQVGRPGVDGIAFGYRSREDGFWAYYPMEGRFALLAPTVADFASGWKAGTISL